MQLLTQEVPLPLQDVVVGGAPLAPPTSDHISSSEPRPLNKRMSPETKGVHFNENNEIMGGASTGGVSSPCTPDPHSTSAGYSHSCHVTSDHVIGTRPLADNKDTPIKGTEPVHVDTPTSIVTSTSMDTRVTRDQSSKSPTVTTTGIQTLSSNVAKLGNTPPPNMSTHCDPPPNLFMESSPFGTKTPPPNVSKTPPPNVSKTPPPNVSTSQSNDITWGDDSLIKTDQSNDLTGNEDDLMEEEDVIAQVGNGWVRLHPLIIITHVHE